MFRIYKFILILSMLVMPVFAVNAEESSSHNDKSQKIIIHFHTMFGVDKPFLSSNPSQSSDPTVRGVLGDYQSWKINRSVNGILFADGRLIINIKGLIFGDGSPNDEDHFRALVSCQLTPDVPGGEAATFSNFITAPFPVHNPIGKGNAKIDAKIPLPSPCVAPVVMILNGNPADGNVWFAITGN
ncbi:MAG: hypothetical protein PHF31_07200 [Methylobacter sp.]|nr:hypothetical protein [Methylobacter sp.]